MVPVRVITLTADGRDELYERCVSALMRTLASSDTIPVCPLDDALPRDPLSFLIHVQVFRLRIYQKELQFATRFNERSLGEDFERM